MIREVSVLNIKILLISRTELLKNFKEGVLFTPNLDHLVKLQNDQEFYRIYKKAEWIICDSKILYHCSKLLKQRFPETIPGSSFFTSYYLYHKNNLNCKIFLLGAMPGVADKAMQKINLICGRNIVVGAFSPSYGFEKDINECRMIYKIINESGANVVLVGVGAPKQEKWIMTHKVQMPYVKTWMALGATIDFEAGNIRRAPIFYQKMGLEWFYRFLKEPKRLYRRYFIEDLRFFWYFSKQLLGKYKNPFE